MTNEIHLHKHFYVIIRLLQIVGDGGMKQECTVDDLVKMVEDLTRIH